MPDVPVSTIAFLLATAIGAVLCGPLVRAACRPARLPDEPRPRGEVGIGTVRPGVALLVTFDPAAHEQLSLVDDIVAIRTAFDQMLVRKGLVSGEQLAMIRSGTGTRAVVIAMTATGATREDYREVELDLMVSRPTGGQFPAHETALIPGAALTEVAPGCVIDAYYAHGDESSVAVCVPPG